jgi:hypothetical protein
VQLSEYKQRNKRLNDMLSEQKQKHEMHLLLLYTRRLTRKRSMHALSCQEQPENREQN